MRTRFKRADARRAVPLLAVLLAATLAGGCRAPSRATAPPTLVPAKEAGLDPSASVLGFSREGRAIRADRFGSGPRRVYLIGGIHGDERGGVENVRRLGILLASELPPGLCLRFVRDLNPDGTHERARENSCGVDLNRNWPASNFTPDPTRGPEPLSEPESAAVHADFLAFEPELVIVLHAARAGPFVNFDGPGAEPARRFAEAAAEVDPRWHVEPDMGYSTPGSLGSWVGIDQGIPILTIELDRAHSGEDCWRALRAGLLAVLEGLGART